MPNTTLFNDSGKAIADNTFVTKDRFKAAKVANENNSYVFDVYSKNNGRQTFFGFAVAN